MTEFFDVSHNSFDTRGFPWGQSILRGEELVRVCYECTKDPEGRKTWQTRGHVELLLEQGKGNRWPDVLGCGAFPLFIVSRRVIDDWREDGIGEFPSNPVKIANPLPKRLQGTEVPEYFWLDGDAMIGAKLDFDKSGFIGVSFCPACSARTHNIRTTYDRQHSGTWPKMFLEGSWNGTHIFTTDLSSTSFFCTEVVVACARKHKHTNFRFVPAERAASSTEGIKYLPR